MTKSFAAKAVQAAPTAGLGAKLASAFSRIGVRLGAAFASIVLMLLMCVSVGVLRLGSLNDSLRSMLQREVAASEIAAQMDSQAQAVARTLGQALLTDRVDEIQALLRDVDALLAENAEAGKALDAALSRDADNALLKALAASEPGYVAQIRKVARAIKSGDADGARLQLNDRPLREASTAYLGALAALRAAQNVDMQAAKANAEKVYSSGRNILFAATALAVALAAVLGFLIVRSITRQLGGEPIDAADTAQAVARGDLSRRIVLRRGDRTSVLAAMHAMMERLRDFSAAQREVAQRHEAGDTAATIDASKFEGAYREMAEGVNELAAGHIRVMGEAISIVGEYAQGNLARDLAPMPGERSKINAAIAGVKANLTAINGEILKLTNAASRGDFTARGDEGCFEYDFRTMIAGLNGLMEVSDRGLAEVGKTLEALSRGDLTARIDGDYQGTFGELKDNSNETAERLGQIVAQIRESAQSISTGSGEMAQGNGDLSQRTTEQASSLQATAASMEQLTGTVRQNAENAKQANQLAVSASGVATRGGQVVSQVVETMGAISASAKKIADIIAVIDDIAFQTNILALNAAVEAARAGDQGRGFAVVATEVRSLAQRSAEAAREIKSLIGDSVDKVGAGTKLVADAGRTMEEVVNSVQRVADIISEITVASQEQSAGIEQVNQAITQMDHVTQQNAALVEQAAAAAESMREQAHGLTQAVSVFQIASSAK